MKVWYYIYEMRWEPRQLQISFFIYISIILHYNIKVNKKSLCKKSEFFYIYLLHKMLSKPYQKPAYKKSIKWSRCDIHYVLEVMALSAVKKIPHFKAESNNKHNKNKCGNINKRISYKRYIHFLPLPSILWYLPLATSESIAFIRDLNLSETFT